MKRIRELPEFEGSFKNEQGADKPVMIVTVDGGPDENPRYQKTIACAIEYFNYVDLDALFIATNAPGRSAFNRCERRMAPLSKELAGLILEHDHFGTHLNAKGETVNEELEMKNFYQAGTILAEIWSSLVLDGHLTVAEYIPSGEETTPRQMSEEWKSIHTRRSHFFLQIVKCDNIDCCRPFRSSYRTLIPNRFVPPPIPVVQTQTELKWASNDTGATYLTLSQNVTMKDALQPESARKKYLNEMPYDFSNPAVDSDTMTKRLCTKCKRLFGAINMKDAHQKMCVGPKKHPRDPATQDIAAMIQNIPYNWESCSSKQGIDAAPVRSIRPARLKARRSLEILCLMESDELDWYEIDDIDTSGLELPPERHIQHGTPVLGDHESIWSIDD